MSVKALSFGVAFLLACNVASAPATFTPGPDCDALGSETNIPGLLACNHFQTQSAPAQETIAPDPTPSQEIATWECDSINGWLLSPHCGLDPWFVAVNSNSDLFAVISEPVRVRVDLLNGNVAYRDVFYPAPPTYYNWYFDTQGHDGSSIIPGMPPIVSHNGEGFDVNITSLSGYIALRLELTELFDPPGRYVVGFELTPDVSLPETSKSNPALITKQCRIRTDTGNHYELALQNAGHNRYSKTPDSAVYLIEVDNKTAIQLECGIHVAQPVFNGIIKWDRVFIEPVPPEYGDVAIAIK